jgi:hypothetical protein
VEDIGGSYVPSRRWIRKGTSSPFMAHLSIIFFLTSFLWLLYPHPFFLHAGRRLPRRHAVRPPTTAPSSTPPPFLIPPLVSPAAGHRPDHHPTPPSRWCYHAASPPPPAEPPPPSVL